MSHTLWPFNTQNDHPRDLLSWFLPLWLRKKCFTEKEWPHFSRREKLISTHSLCLLARGSSFPVSQAMCWTSWEDHGVAPGHLSDSLFSPIKRTGMSSQGHGMRSWECLWNTHALTIRKPSEYLVLLVNWEFILHTCACQVLPLKNFCHSEKLTGLVLLGLCHEHWGRSYG